MGDVTDRVYAIHPKHMKVNFPSHVADAEMGAPYYGTRSETAVTQMNARIRLAEICRDIADALPLDGGDIELLPYSKIAALDGRFEQILADWPLRELTRLPGAADREERRVASQRSIGVLSVHARRAKLLRPLLQIRDMAEKFEPFRRQCLRSAEAVIEIASSLLSETVDTPGVQSGSGSGSGTPPKSPYHGGIVITHVRRPVLHRLLFSLSPSLSVSISLRRSRPSCSLSAASPPPLPIVP